VARAKLAGHGNNGDTVFHRLSVNSLPFAAGSLDLAYSLGVLRHVPDTRAAIASIARVLKPDAPFLVYLYYAFDHRPWWFRMLWRMSNLLSVAFPGSRMVRKVSAPRLSRRRFIGRWRVAPGCWTTLAACRAHGRWPTIATAPSTSCAPMHWTALARGWKSVLPGARSRACMQDAGFERITFSSTEPFWCALGFKAAGSATTGSATGAGESATGATGQARMTP
jgi:SAM-dependent methyltransferase